MAYDVYLICFLGETRPIDVVKELWPEHRHLTGPDSGLAEGGAELLIVADERKNGVTLVGDVYKRIQEEADGRPFRGIVIPMTSTLAGYHKSDIVEWIQKVTQ
ncbi:MAG: hypothetical protein F4086_17690 [Gemmatimonadetes bacterium]|nr:hypothetical protein [Gammaproteobacteria bacterium]MYE95458.1 hypothetical protein [Gemmatimonadota bacterium]MYJ12139.1 hypothetical protein [Gemmatimonadota bacterium]